MTWFWKLLQLKKECINENELCIKNNPHFT
jgi:hypothetical protein